MKINFTKQDPICYNANDGQITINSIDLSAIEQYKYGKNYSIEWSSNVSSEQIHSKFFVYKLKADKYQFRLCNNEYYSDWTEIELINKEPLKIITINQDNNPCDKIASISIQINGGQPPYVAYYGPHLATSNTNYIEISNIFAYQSFPIKVVDANNCSVLSDNNITTNFSQLFYDIVSNTSPIIYDDHPQEFLITIKNGYGPYRFIVYDSNDGIKDKILYETKFEDNYLIDNINEFNHYTYNLASILYPGSYIIDIIDSHNCIHTTETIAIPNADPISVKAIYGNNTYQPISNPIPIDSIFDTLLIPYALLINNLSLIEFIKTLGAIPNIDIQIGKKTYKQKIIHNNKDYSQNINNIFHILQLGSSSSDWYFSINIARGFNEKDNIFAENIFLQYNNQNYLIVPFLDDDISSIKLIKGNLLITDFNITQFELHNTIHFFNSNDTLNSIAELNNYNTYRLYNTYHPGSVFVINPIDWSNCIDVINFNHVEDYVFNDINIQQNINLKHILEIINDNNKNIYISAIDNKFNGVIKLGIHGGIVDNHQYKINYYKYDHNTQKLLNIYYNNKITQSNSIYDLSPSTYIIKIIDNVGNKIKYINNQSYDNHYIAAKKYINNILNITETQIGFEYGDIIINILDDNTNYTLSDVYTNIPGISSDETTKSNQNSSILNKIQSKPIISGNSNYNNILDIISPYNIECSITGPNNFNHIFTGNIQFINMYPGVYNIVGNQTQLTKEYLLNNSNQIYIGDNTKECININFQSYSNKFIAST